MNIIYVAIVHASLNFNLYLTKYILVRVLEICVVNQKEKDFVTYILWPVL